MFFAHSSGLSVFKSSPRGAGAVMLVVVVVVVRGYLGTVMKPIFRRHRRHIRVTATSRIRSKFSGLFSTPPKNRR